LIQKKLYLLLWFFVLNLMWLFYIYMLILVCLKLIK
jgi:hypothetical protein